MNIINVLLEIILWRQHESVYEYVVNCIEKREEYQASQDMNMYHYYSGEVEAIQAVMSWLGFDKIYKRIRQYEQWRYHAKYNLRVDDYPTQ